MKDYLVGDMREPYKYIEKMSRGGLSEFPPLIVTCAITGGIHGAETNPNLPEDVKAQAQSAYDAYNAGASMIHIHRRDPNNLSIMTTKAEDFLEANALIRAKCPDVIINNNCVGGRAWIRETQTMSDQLLASVGAKPELASFDTTNFCVDIRLGPRKAPLPNPNEGGVRSINYIMMEPDAINAVKIMAENDIKPEFELFDPGDVKYLMMLIKKNLVKPPYWCSALFNGIGTLPSPEIMIATVNALPPESLLSIIGIGASQFPMVGLGIIMGHHIRVGMEDNVYYSPGELAKSNAQMVERAVRLAHELGRKVATPAQAREMIGLSATPRPYTV